MKKVLDNYGGWNPYTLKRAKNILISKGHNLEDSEELRILTTLLNYDCNIVEKEDNGNFARVFRDNNRLFEEDYANYMWYIVEYYERQNVIDEIEPYKIMGVSYEYIMAKLDNFMENINPDWYDIFFDLYINRKDIIRFSNASTKSLYLPESDLWLANVQKRDTIENYANIAKVFGEGIAIKLHRKCARTPDEQVLIQAFAKAIQYLFVAGLKDYGIQKEITKFFNRNCSDNSRRVKSVYEKFIIDAFISNPKSAKEVANYLNNRCIMYVTKEFIEESYKKTVKKDIQKILTDLILRELLLTYENDQEKFVHDMNALVTSEENPAKTLEKLDIRLNSIYCR